MKLKNVYLVLFSISLLADRSVCAYDVMRYGFSNENWNNPNAPYLAVDLSDLTVEPRDVANNLCRTLGLDGEMEIKTSEVTINDPEKNVVDINSYGLKAFPISKVLPKSSDSRPYSKTIRIFVKLHCKDIPLNKVSLFIHESVQSTLKESSAVSPSTHDEENAIFEISKKSPEVLLKEMYEKSKILFLGKANHESFQTYVYLEELLKAIKDDSNLKYLVLERSHISEAFFNASSIEGIISELYKEYMSTPAHQASIHPYGKSGRATDPYILAALIPLIQKINETRPDNPVTIVPVDSFDYGAEFPLFPVAVDNPMAYESHQLLRETTWNRENDTMENFQNKILNKLGVNGKAIVVYHSFHMIQGIEARFPKVNSDKGVYESSDWHPSDWLGMLFKSQPELRKESNIVLFDEEGKGEPSGAFVFSQRHRGAGEFGVELAPFAGKLSEKGLELFDERHAIRNVKYGFSGLMRSEADISQMADALIYSPDAQSVTQRKMPKIKSKIESMFGR